MTSVSGPPSCSFTKKSSSTHHKLETGVCDGASKQKPKRRKAVFIGCKNCSDNENIMWRCSSCYMLFRNKIEQNICKSNCHPVIKALLMIEWSAINWKNVNEFQKKFEEYFILEKCKWLNNTNALVWRTCCPCCYDYRFERVDKVWNIPNPNLLLCHMKSFIHYPQFNVKTINPISGESNGFEMKQLVIVEFNSVLSINIENNYVYHYLQQHDMKYTNVETLIINRYNIEFKTGDWLLVLGNVPEHERTESRTQHSVLSLKCFGALTSVVDCSNINEIQRSSKLVAEISHLSTGEKRDIHDTAKRKKQKMWQDGIFSATFSVHRQSGPYGNMSEVLLSTIRNKLHSGQVQNGIARTKYATILIPATPNRNMKLVTKVVPYYVSLRNEHCKVVCPPKTALPQYGWIHSSENFVNMVHNKKTLTEVGIVKSDAMLVYQVLCAEVCTLITGCFLLENLSHEYCLLLNENVYSSGINLYNDIVKKDTTSKQKLRELCGNGRLSSVFSRTAGHTDSYTGASPKDECVGLESKLVLALGPIELCSDNKNDMSTSSNGTVPMGCLGFPKFKIYSNCCPMQDVELHYLPFVVHATGENVKEPSHRGTFMKVNEKTYLVPFGGSITRMIDVRRISEEIPCEETA